MMNQSMNEMLVVPYEKDLEIEREILDTPGM